MASLILPAGPYTDLEIPHLCAFLVTNYNGNALQVAVFIVNIDFQYHLN